ncbi:MAG: FecR domain-containing protein [Kordiimonas sp.]
MSNTSENNTQDKTVLEQAADYYLALQENTMSGAELKAWQSWFLRSKEHQEAFQRLEALWGALDGLSIDDFDVSKNAIVRENTGTPANDGSILDLLASDGTANDQPRSAPLLGWAQAIAACLAVVAVTAYLTFVPGEVPVTQATLYETAINKSRVVTLADGSILEIGADSEVAVDYSDDVRHLTLLRGEAVFTVSKNPNRPFVVNAGIGSVTAIGTVFNVSKTGDEVAVRVLEGTVAVRPTAESELASAPVALVTAGLQTHYSDEGVLRPVEEADVRAGLEWRVGVLTMVDRQLGDVIQVLNRFVENEITIGDEAIADFSFTGTVYPDQVDDWLAGLQQGYPLKVMRVGSSTVLMLDEKDTNSSTRS